MPSTDRLSLTSAYLGYLSLIRKKKKKKVGQGIIPKRSLSAGQALKEKKWSLAFFLVPLSGYLFFFFFNMHLRAISPLYTYLNFILVCVLLMLCVSCIHANWCPNQACYKCWSPEADWPYHLFTDGWH